MITIESFDEKSTAVSRSALVRTMSDGGVTPQAVAFECDGTGAVERHAVFQNVASRRYDAVGL